MTNDSSTRTEPPSSSSGGDTESAKIGRNAAITAALIAAIGGIIAAVIQLGGGQGKDGSEPEPSGRAGGGGAKSSGTTFTAKIRWTDDQGGTSISTILKAYTSPTSHTSTGTHNLGDTVTVTCQAQGRGVPVGPTYAGPNAGSSVWYRLDTGSYVTAVYTAVDRAGSVPRCAQN